MALQDEICVKREMMMYRAKIISTAFAEVPRKVHIGTHFDKFIYDVDGIFTRYLSVEHLE